MANESYDSFKDLRKGKYDCKVKARVMNLWRGYTKSGEPFSNFNMLLLDHKHSRIHAFVPTSIAPSLEKAIEQGKIYLFKNFTVKDYKEDDRFRCINRPIQIVFGSETKVLELEETEHIIEHAVFDFYDLGDLTALTKQNTYLADVVGVVQEKEISLIDIKNRHGTRQMQIKFNITDGRKRVKVTFWDAVAEMFHDTVKLYDFELPLIIIIGSGRVTEWNGQIEISNVAATSFYINFNHHSVNHLRKMLKNSEFNGLLKTFRKYMPTKICTVQELNNLGEDDIETDVLCKLKIDEVIEGNWYRNICTSCYKDLKKVDAKYQCIFCPRNVPYPDKWFQLRIRASDVTGAIDIILDNVSGSKYFAKTAHEIIEEGNEIPFPPVLRQIEKKEYTMKLFITKEIISRRTKIYTATDLIEGHRLGRIENESEDGLPKPIEDSFAEPSFSTFPQDSISKNQ